MTAFFPEALRGVDFVRVRFRLVFLEDYRLTTEAALRLRRNLRQAALLSFGGSPERARALFDPPLPSDPVAVRRYQRPSPLFVILPPEELPRDLDEGDGLDLDVLFWGNGIGQMGDFARVLQDLGRLGWHRGEGRFELTGMSVADPSGAYRPLWKRGQAFGILAPAVQSAAWWLDASGRLRPPLRISFRTPARILAEGRPIFRPSFARLFPFLLRRVTSMLYAACAVELLPDPASLLAPAALVREQENHLAWSDWRTLEADVSREIGGVTGSILLDGEGLEEIEWVLLLASLMNVGKGASFGAGHFRVVEG